MLKDAKSLWLLIIVVVIIVLGFWFVSENNKKATAPSKAVAVSTPAGSNVAESISVKIIEGDVVVSKGGQDTKITSWGYNSEPVLSPDESKVAYVSETEESKESEKVDRGIKRTSTNAWIINADGSNPVKLTSHVNFVYRGALYWLDDNRLLFSDGVGSFKVYDLVSKSFRTVMGSSEPGRSCLDACGFETKVFYSPNHTYVVELSGGYKDLASILNTQTLVPIKVSQRLGVDFATVTFPAENTMVFNATKLEDDISLDVTLDLSSGGLELK